MSLENASYQGTCRRCGRVDVLIYDTGEPEMNVCKRCYAELEVLG